MTTGPDCRLYESFGVTLPESPNGSGQLITDCPFCGRVNHFYIDKKTALYQCKDTNCGLSGNPYTFLEALYQQAKRETTPFSYRRLSAKRGKFPQAAFENSNVVFSRSLDRWLIPYRNVERRLVGLSSYNGNGAPIGAPGCAVHLYGLDELSKVGPVFLCEGQWDAIALKWLLSKCDNRPDSYSVLGVPGAGSLPKSDIVHLQGRDVYLLFDNDEAGRVGLKQACKKLSGVASDILLLQWPEGSRDGFDIEDYIREAPGRPEETLNDLLSWCFRFQKGVTDPTEEKPGLVRNTIEEVIKDYTDSQIYMYQGLKDLLVLSSAVVLSTNLQGEPLWLYAIGDPGAGKSLVLESTLGSKRCIYRTSITHKAFLTGFRNEGEDRSLLALLPGRSLIVKDYSNILSLPHAEQDQLVSLLREAFDGRVVRSYGNNVYREYPPPDSIHKDCRFSFVAGVTKEIHARSHAGLGERFLKYEIVRSDEDNIRAMHAALDVSWKTHERQVFRAASVGAFLDRTFDWDNLPPVGQEFLSRIIDLSRFVGLARSPVSRTDGDLDYSPSPESGTRVAKQLLKLSQSLCMVMGLSEVNGEVYRLVRKVAWDTAHSWRRNLMLYLYNNPEPAGTHKIASGSLLSVGTCHRQLYDMLALGIVKRNSEETPITWSLTPDLQNTITNARIGEVNQ